MDDVLRVKLEEDGAAHGHAQLASVTTSSRVPEAPVGPGSRKTQAHWRAVTSTRTVAGLFASGQFQKRPSMVAERAARRDGVDAQEHRDGDASVSTWSRRRSRACSGRPAPRAAGGRAGRSPITRTTIARQIVVATVR